MQIGNKDNMAAVSGDGQLAEKVLDEYMQDFQQRNPNMHVFSAHLHMDEATPHLTIAGLKQKISELTRTVVSLKKQLDEYRSVSGQLDRGKLQSENTELRKQNSVFKTIIEQYDLGHLLDRNRNQRNERDTR